MYYQAELLSKSGNNVWVVTENSEQTWVKDNTFELKYTDSEKVRKTIDGKNLWRKLLIHAGKWIGLCRPYPDAHTYWQQSALDESSQIINAHIVDIILVSLGSPSALEVAYRLKQKFHHLRIVIDVRDLWVGNPVRFMGRGRWQPFRDLRDQVNERRWFSIADGVVNVSQHHSQVLQKRYPEIPAERFHVIQNGFHEEAFGKAVPLRDEGDVLVIRYLGFLLPEMQGQVFFRALKHVVDNDPLNGNGIRCEFYGGNPQFIQQEAERAGVSQFVQANGYVDHEQAVSLMLGADVLLLFWTNDPGCMCGKFYEYLRSGRYILAFDQNNVDAREVLEESARGDWLSINDTDGHKRKLRKLLETRRSGIPIQQKNLPEVAKFSRQSQTNELAKILATTTSR